MNKNRFILTITDVRGTKSYNLHQAMKKVFLNFLGFILVLLILGSLTIGSTNRELNRINEKTSKIKNEYLALEKDNKILSDNISIKERELDELNGKIENIEEIIGLKSDETTYEGRVDLATITSAQKQFMLQNIPSGYPVIYSGITGKFGNRMHPVLKRKAFHPGIDLRAKMNTPLKVTADGIVEYAAYSKGSGYGNLIIIHHAFGFKTYYGHLNKVTTKAGNAVRKGDIIGYTGNTGLSSGPHLHYEVRHIQKPLNPINFLKWNMVHYDKIFKREKRVKWQSLIKLAQHQTMLKVQQSSLSVQK